VRKMVRLGDICRKITDGTHHSPVNRPVGPFKYITAKNIKPWGLDLSDITYVDEPTHREIFSRCDVQPNDVLLVKDGATTGRVAVNTLQEPFSLLSSVGVLRPGPNLEPRYLAYALQSPAVQDAMFAKMSGVAITRLTLKKIKELEVPIVGLDEQRHIVAEIDKQFSRLDEAVANLQRVKANLKRYKAAVLKAAVEGRLVETEASIARREGRSYEAGEQLLQRILAERRSTWAGKGKYKEPASVDAIPEAEPPEGWTWCNFDQVSSSERNALKAGPFGSALKKEFYVPVGYKIYGQEQVIAGDHKFGDYYISEEKYRELENCAVKPGDILVSLVGTTGKVLVLPEGSEPGIINPRLIKLSLNPQFVSAQYASYYLQSVPARSFFKLQAHGGTMEILNLGIVKALPVCLPPMTEQARIVAQVDRHLSIIREVETEVDTNLRRAQALRQAALWSAFNRVEVA
jgi:type I restriction enzyme, S subunit